MTHRWDIHHAQESTTFASSRSLMVQRRCFALIWASRSSSGTSILRAVPLHVLTNPVPCCGTGGGRSAGAATSKATESPTTTTFNKCTPGPNPSDSIVALFVRTVMNKGYSIHLICQHSRHPADTHFQRQATFPASTPCSVTSVSTGFRVVRDNDPLKKLCVFAPLCEKTLKREVEQCASKGAEVRIVSRAKPQRRKGRLESAAVCDRREVC